MATEDLCIACSEPLVIAVEGNGEEIVTENTAIPGIVDDIKLRCGHHYHWSCFAEEYSSDEATPETKKQCPSCSSIITDPASEKLLVTLRNEGGLQTNFDLGAMLDEEEFYDRNPEFKKTRAFLEFCAEGDIESVIDLLEDDEDLLNVQDFETGQTGLHVAVQNQREEIVTLLCERGADRNILDASGKSFYDLAVVMGASPEQLRRLAGI